MRTTTLSETFDHTSQLRSLEARFGVPVPNLSTWRRGATGDLTSALQPRAQNTSIPPLPHPQLDDPRVIRECQPSHLNQLNVPVPPYPLPAQQQVPLQEPGPARRLPHS